MQTRCKQRACARIVSEAITTVARGNVAAHSRAAAKLTLFPGQEEGDGPPAQRNNGGPYLDRFDKEGHFSSF